MTTVSPQEWLRNEFFRKKERNTSYSVRAFARDLGISQSLLTWILNGQRHVTLKQAYKICSTLRLSPTVEKRFLDSVLYHLPEASRMNEEQAQARAKVDSSMIARPIELEEFQAIAQWHHTAILTLSTLTSFQPDTRWISERLGISRAEAESAVERLLALGLLKEIDGAWKPASRHVKVRNPRSQAAIRVFYEGVIGKAQAELKKTSDEDFQRRSITGVTLAVPASSVPELKAYLEEVKEEVIRRFSTSASDEVYQLNLQLFPLTQTQTQTPSKNRRQK